MRGLSACTSIRGPSTPASSIQSNRVRVVRLNCTTPPNTASLASDFRNLGEPASVGGQSLLNEGLARATPVMKRFSWLLFGVLLALGYGFVRENPKQRLLAVVDRLPEADSGKSESAETDPQAPQPATQPMMKVVSPLASWMGKDESEQPRQEHSAPRKPNPSDH